MRKLQIPEEYKDLCSLLIYLPEKQIAIRVSDGTGDQLLPEDYEAGWNDYIDWHATEYVGDGECDDMFRDVDAGLYLYDNTDVEDWMEMIVPAVESAVGDDVTDFIVLGDGEV